MHQIICGDAATELAKLAPNSVALTVTSPPYFRHRDYAVSGQIGREKSLDEYLIRMKSVLLELLRVSRRDGACFVIIGDTYRSGRLLLVPHRLAILASQVGWVVRNDIIWNKLDPAPDSAKNRWRSAHEHILFLTKQSSGYQFNADAIRIPYSPVTLRRWGAMQKYGGSKSAGRQNGNAPRIAHAKTFTLNPRGCLPTDVWSLPSGNSSLLHYAAFSPDLVATFIRACTAEGDLVLDPFLGSGTTIAVAKSLGRPAIGIELNSEYASMAAALVDALA